jgi:drug/metabolite transporter (DMT)-like permease
VHKSASSTAGPRMRGLLEHPHASTHLVLAVVFALLSALAFAAAMVAQQRAAGRVPDETSHGQLFIHLVRSPQWLAGTGGSGAGYLLQAVALGFGSVLVVAPLLVTSLLFALPWAAWLAGRRLPAAVWIWGLVLATSLAVFVTTGNPNDGRSHASHHAWIIAGLVSAPIVVACVLAATRARGATRASLLAVAVGVLAGGLAVLTKAVIFDLEHGVVRALSSWELYALLIVGGLGIYLQQLSFQAGALQASLPVITVLEPVVAAVLGIFLLHETLRVGGARLPVLIVAVVAMTFATIALARGRVYLDERTGSTARGRPRQPGSAQDTTDSEVHRAEASTTTAAAAAE